MMNERILELALQAGVTGYFAAGTKLATPIPLSPEMEIFAELIIRECAKWMNDGNIPDGFYESGRMLKHFGLEE